MTAADYIARFLVERGVRHVFGFQGSAMLKMLDAMMATGRLEYVQNFHEQASAFAADAYARVSGGVGVAIATSGPGASNLISGIANAYFDSVPALFITGQDYTCNVANPTHARQNGFQDMDIVSMVKPVAKYAVMADRAERIPAELKRAWKEATSGRKGPALIDVPIDVQFAEIPEDAADFSIGDEEPLFEADPVSLEAAKKLILAAKCPVLLAGGGIRSAGAAEDFRRVADKLGVPVVATLNGIDAYADAVGFSGLYGTTAANLCLKHCDLLVSMGARFALQHTSKHPSEYAPDAKVVQVEIDGTEINRTFMWADAVVKSDLRTFLPWLEQNVPQLQIGEWRRRVAEWRRTHRDTVSFPGYRGVNPVDFVRRLADELPEDAVVTADVGANQMWVAQAFRPRSGQRLLNSAGFGAMGYSLPAAIGASYCASGPVVAVTGDGGFQMNMQELNVLALRRNNVKCVVFNNNCLGLMREVQTRYYSSHFHGNTPAEFACPDLEKLAAAYGLPYFRVETVADFGKTAATIAMEGPAVMDVIVDPGHRTLIRYDDEDFRNG